MTFMRFAFCALLALPMLAGPLAAQPLRTTVVPAEAGVVIPPRGQPMPAAVTRRAPPANLPPFDPAPATMSFAPAPMALGAVPGLLLPLAAGLLLGAGMPGGGGSAAPATTTR